MAETGNISKAQSASSEATLATLLHLIRRSRQSGSAASLRFLLVNETHALVPYRQSAFWSKAEGVAALSGVAETEQHAPYVRWVAKWCAQGRDIHNEAFTSDLRVLSATDGGDWSEWLPPHLATINLPPTGEFLGGRLLLARETAFTQAELKLLQEWADAWAARYAAVQPHAVLSKLFHPYKQTSKKRWLVRAGGAAVLLGLACLPVQLTVLAPSELVPLDPAVIRAPMDGIIDTVNVTPNERVQPDQTLFAFDRVSLASRLQVAERALLTIQAEYRRNAQRAVYDQESKAELSILQSQIQERQVEVTYLRELNERSVVSSPRAGLVLFDDAADLLGRPVVTGEKVMVVAGEKQSQVEAWVSPADMIAFSDSSQVNVYLAADPINPIRAKIEYVAHMAELRPDGLYAYRVRARLDELSSKQAQPRVGLKGTAKIEGERVPLIYWVLRRPWAALRGWIGL